MPDAATIPDLIQLLQQSQGFVVHNFYEYIFFFLKDNQNMGEIKGHMKVFIANRPHTKLKILADDRNMQQRFSSLFILYFSLTKIHDKTSIFTTLFKTKHWLK